jgi:hypothetical protein
LSRPGGSFGSGDSDRAKMSAATVTPSLGVAHGSVPVSYIVGLQYNDEIRVNSTDPKEEG